MHLDDALSARLTARFGMRVTPETADRMSGVLRKRVGVVAGADLTADVLERLLYNDGVPCAWAYDQDEEFTYFDAYYVGCCGAHHGDA